MTNPRGRRRVLTLSRLRDRTCRAEGSNRVESRLVVWGDSDNGGCNLGRSVLASAHESLGGVLEGRIKVQVLS